MKPTDLAIVAAPIYAVLLAVHVKSEHWRTVTDDFDSACAALARKAVGHAGRLITEANAVAKGG